MHAGAMSTESSSIRCSCILRLVRPRVERQVRFVQLREWPQLHHVGQIDSVI